MRTLIVADVHLDATANGTAEIQEFSAFLRRVPDMEIGRLVLLGDLFDFWFEYRHVIFSAYFPVLRALDELREAGIEIHLVCGNHDFWAGRFLETIPVHVHPADFRIEEGRRALFIHGDGLNKADWLYRAYKRFARSPFVIGCFRLIHPDLAMKIAQRVSRTSRRGGEGHTKNEREADAIRDYARGVLESGHADLVFSGHTHDPDDAEFGGGHYHNTGAWLHDRYYMIWDGQSVERFSDASQPDN